MHNNLGLDRVRGSVMIITGPIEMCLRKHSASLRSNTDMQARDHIIGTANSLAKKNITAIIPTAVFEYFPVLEHCQANKLKTQLLIAAVQRFAICIAQVKSIN